MKDFLTKHRGLVIFLFAVPFSFIYQKIQDFQNWFYRNFRNTNKLHDTAVLEIQKAVQAAAASGKKMCTARKPWKTMSIRTATFKNDMAQIPIDLRNILDLDEKEGYVRVEPMATMGDITHFLVPKGYALAVQVEMDDLTVGGLCMGVGIETSSHRYGFLFETVRAFEVVTADGQLVRATREENAELFHALPWSHGTIGFLVAVELKVIPVKKYMRLTYLPFHSQDEFCENFKTLSESENPRSFLEALVFSPNTGVIMCGEFDDGKSNNNISINPINRWHKQWFYKHVESFLHSGKGEELIPLRHYFHRHTPSIFFQLKDLIPFGNKPWYRWLFAWLGAPKISLMKYTMTKELRHRAFLNRATQDVIVPVSRMGEVLDFIHPNYEIYPLWVCPVKLLDHGQHEGFLWNPDNLLDNNNYEMYVDIGIYGIPPGAQRKTWDAIPTSRNLEHLVAKMKGYHMLYADIFMTRKEFEDMFNHKLYRKMRAKYKAETAFPEVYDKIVPEKWLFDINSYLAETEASKKVAVGSRQ
ncbi:MAG: FAD-binding protein [Bacteroidota bacterium]